MRYMKIFVFFKVRELYFNSNKLFCSQCFPCYAVKSVIFNSDDFREQTSCCSCWRSYDGMVVGGVVGAGKLPDDEHDQFS